MKIRVALLTLILTVSSVAAESVASPPSREEIRDQYSKSVADGPPVPSEIKLALIAAEDTDFFDTPPQFSEITQHLVRYHHSVPVRLIHRAYTYAYIEALSRNEILNWYSKEVYVGQNCFGFSSAAEAFFGKSASNLSIEEAAVLAGLIEAPSFFLRAKNAARLLQRRNHIIFEMANAGFVSEHAALQAIAKPVSFREPLSRCDVN